MPCRAMAAPPEREEVGRGSCSHTGSHMVFGILILPSENMEKAVLKYELWSLRALHTHKFSVLASRGRWEVSAYKNSTWCAPRHWVCRATHENFQGSTLPKCLLT